jgi:hypothetical protein
MTDSSKQEYGTNADSHGHCGIIEVKERRNQIWSDQQAKDDRYVCHPENYWRGGTIPRARR